MGTGFSALARGGLALAAIASFTARSAAAEQAPRLVYAIHEGTPGCPSEAEFRDAVAARLGQNAFVDDSPRTLSVDVRLEGVEFFASGALIEADGSSAGARRMTGDDCREVVEGMALAASIAMSGGLALGPEPSDLAPVAPVAPVATKPKTQEKAVVVSAPSRAPATTEVDDGVETEEMAEREKRNAFGGGLTFHAALGVGPGVAAGGSLFVTGRRASWSVNVEARYDVLSTGMSFETGGSAWTTLLAGAMAPCRHFGAVAACALGLVGRFSAESEDVSVPGSDSGPYLAAGGRVAAEWSWSKEVLVQGRFELLGTLLPVTMELGDAEVWSSPPVSGLVGAGIVLLP